jgi:hypothetical protein
MNNMYLAILSYKGVVYIYKASYFTNSYINTLNFCTIFSYFRL